MRLVECWDSDMVYVVRRFQGPERSPLSLLRLTHVGCYDRTCVMLIETSGLKEFLMSSNGAYLGQANRAGSLDIYTYIQAPDRYWDIEYRTSNTQLHIPPTLTFTKETPFCIIAKVIHNSTSH